MVPLVTPCHVAAAGFWECDNCIPVVVLLGREALWSGSRELPAGFAALFRAIIPKLTESLLENHSTQRM